MASVHHHQHSKQPSLVEGLEKKLAKIQLEQQQHHSLNKDKHNRQVQNQPQDSNHPDRDACLPVDSDIGRYDGGFERAEDDSERSVELLRGDAAKILDLDTGRTGLVDCSHSCFGIMP